MACVVVAYISMAYVVVAFIIMAYIVMAYIVMACAAVAYIDFRLRTGLCSIVSFHRRPERAAVDPCTHCDALRSRVHICLWLSVWLWPI